jgi:hypothetical protein
MAFHAANRPIRIQLYCEQARAPDCHRYFSRDSRRYRTHLHVRNRRSTLLIGRFATKYSAGWQSSLLRRSLVRTWNRDVLAHSQHRETNQLVPGPLGYGFCRRHRPVDFDGHARPATSPFCRLYNVRNPWRPADDPVASAACAATKVNVFGKVARYWSDPRETRSLVFAKLLDLNYMPLLNLKTRPRNELSGHDYFLPIQSTGKLAEAGVLSEV